MSVIYFYLKDTTKEFTGEGESYLDANGIEIIPPESTLIAPPAFTAGVDIPVFDDILETWSLVTDLRGTIYLNLTTYALDTIVDINTPIPPGTTDTFNLLDFDDIRGEPNDNLLLDSDFKFWTEGLSVAPTTYRYISGAFAAERENGTVGTTVTREAGFDNSRYAARITRDAADASLDEIRIGQILSVEEAIHYGGQEVTFSFTCRPGVDYSANNMELVSQIYAGTATDEEGGNLTAFSAGSTVDSKTHVLINNEFRYRHTFTLPAGARQIKVVLQYTPTGVAAAQDYFEVTNMKLEASSSATPYVSDSLSVAQDKLDEYYLTTYEDGVAAGTITDVGRHAYHIPANITSDNFVLENVRFNFPRIPIANIYSPTAGTPNTITLDDGGAISVVAGAMNDTSSKNSSCAYNDPPTAPDEAILYYHYTLDARI